MAKTYTLFSSFSGSGNLGTAQLDPLLLCFSKAWQSSCQPGLWSHLKVWGRTGSHAQLGSLAKCSSHWGVGLRASVSSWLPARSCPCPVGLSYMPMCFIKASKRKYLLLRHRLHYEQCNQSQNVLGKS